MIRWPFRRHSKGTPDNEAFLVELASAHPGKRYSKIDRYRDFRRVLLDSEQGRRVLYELFSFCGMYQSAAPRAKFQTNETMFLNGQQDIGFRLLAMINAEPKARPASTKE